MKLLFILLLISSVSAGYYVNQPLALPAAPFEFSIKSGSSLKSAAQQIQQTQLLEHPGAFVWLGRLLGKSGQIKPGDYLLEQPVSLLGLLRIVTKGDVNLKHISIIEGWTFKQLRNEINASADIAHDTVHLTDELILQRIGATENYPEGLFFPDTYYFAAGSSDLLIFKRAYQTMQKHVQAAWSTRMPDLPLQTAYQALILASIVEKETGAPADRDKIAGVFVNRLRKGMLLQTDPTVIYGLGDKFDGNLHKRDLSTDTAYNTYTRVGLPTTPIALPGLASLQAALHPANTDALYFVARGDGSSQFSSNLVEHNRAVNKYQK